jgi:hypothetical protein
MMEPVGEHVVPAGPLAVRWLAYELGPVRAGALLLARVAFENAGTATWRQAPGEQVMVSYHWLDELGNPIVWDGLWRALEQEVPPGGRLELPLEVRAPIPPGRYRLAFDLLDEARCWFAEVGSVPLERSVQVLPRITRALAVVVPAHDERTVQALSAQEEALVPPEQAEALAHLAPGCAPAPDWSRRVLDAHQEGFALVGPAIAARGRRLRRELAPWAPGGGRNRAFAFPLLCPSVVAGIEPDWLPDVAGLPAAHAPAVEPAVYDGRAVVTAPRRSDRPPA